MYLVFQYFLSFKYIVCKLLRQVHKIKKKVVQRLELQRNKYHELKRILKNRATYKIFLSYI